MRPEGRRLARGLLLSLLAHGLLLSLIIGGPGQGLPGFGLPWQDRRIEAPDLHVRLALPPVEAVEPGLPREAPVEAPLTATPAWTAAAGGPAAPAETAPAPAPPKPPDLIALARPAPSSWLIPAPPEASPPAASAPPVAQAAAPSASSPETAAPPLPPPPREAVATASARADQEARERAEEQARLDRALQEAQQQARQLEAEREEAARRAAAAARTEAARVDAERQEAARLAAARQEAARQEAARAEAARREAEREEAARQAAAQQESARQEAARQEAARAEAARVSAAQAAAQRREATLRAIGRQLDEEAARREAAAAAASARPSPNSSGTPRRGRLFGRSDANAELVLYAEAWSRKLQLNMTFDMVREAAQQPHTDPLVTVAIRSDGSVESVSFVRSSGVAALDEAIRRVVQSQANYPAFQPALAREYDVIEIRRTWHFDTAIRLY